MSDSAISHVSDTARWVAIYRAMESERPDALFRDPYARMLAGDEGERIVDGLRKGRKFAWPMIVRTAVMDEIIERSVNEEGCDGVLSLGAGLDTRPYRLDLPASLVWIEADLPGISAYKREKMAGEDPICALELAEVDLADEGQRTEFLRRAGRAATRILVVTEGLLGYLEPDDVAALARDLHAQETISTWLTDLGSPRLVRMMNRNWGKAMEKTPFRFAPEEGTAFFEPFGWEELSFRPIFDESIRLGRTLRFARFWRFLGSLYPKKKQEEFRRMSGIVLLGRRETPTAS